MARRTVQVVFNNFPKLAAALPREVGIIVKETVLGIEETAKRAVPVDTGKLRASLQGEMTGPTSGQVGTNIEYAPYVEFGTEKMGAQPYLTPAAEVERRHYLRKMKGLESRLE